MEPSEFTSERTGTLKKVPNTMFDCFEPKKLPLPINYTPELVNLLGITAMNLGKLCEAGQKLKNPHMLITPYLKKEAVLSSKIEGTKTTLSEVFLHETEKRQIINDDLDEVLNYVEALEYGLSKIKTEKISSDLIKKIHKILLKSVRGKDKDPGNYKKILNWIGSTYDPTEATFIPCHPESVEELIENLIEYLNENEKENALLRVALTHYQFETIHPFRDGNGRLGRLLIILFLCQQKIINQPLLYLSAFFEKYREDYNSKLKKVSTAGDIEGWLKFFLTALNEQTKEAVNRLEQMEKLQEKYRKTLRSNTQSTTVLTILDYLFENPFLTIPEVKEKLNCQYPKAKYNVELLLKEKIIEEIKREKGPKLFIAKKIKEIFDDKQTDLEL